MKAREAIRKAKDWIQDVYSDEAIQNVGLEEVRRTGSGDWLITIGFSRPWDKPSAFGIPIADVTGRSYKTVRLDDSSGEVLSSEIRNPAN